jgi:hypothetical protein
MLAECLIKALEEAHVVTASVVLIEGAWGLL